MPFKQAVYFVRTIGEHEYSNSCEYNSATCQVKSYIKTEAILLAYFIKLNPLNISCLNRGRIVARQNNSVLLHMEEDSVLSRSNIPILSFASSFISSSLLFLLKSAQRAFQKTPPIFTARILSVPVCQLLVKILIYKRIPFHILYRIVHYTHCQCDLASSSNALFHMTNTYCITA